jgi:UDP:flavonoid glycosyltransferase YjiC (YdhE family)
MTSGREIQAAAPRPEPAALWSPSTGTNNARMRMLLTCVSGHSHVNNMVPFAVAARARGHEVAFSSAVEVAPVVAAAGFDLLPAGPGRLRVRTEMMRSHRAEMSDKLRDWRTGARMFGDIAPALRWKQLSTVVERYSPDVIVHESLEFAGPLVARLHGLPHVFHSIGPYHVGSMRMVWQRAEPLFQSILGSGSTLRDVVEPYLDVCPPQLQTAAGRRIGTAIRARFAAYHGSPPDAEQRSPGTGRRRVLITFGTVSNDAIPGMFDAAQALGDRGIDVLLTLGPRGWFDWSWSTGAGEPAADPANPWGANVRAVEYVPLAEELQRTDVLIHHGGSNTMRAAIEFGVPALVIPHGAEQHRNARWLAEHGLGRMMMPAQVTAEAVVEQVDALLDDAVTRRRLAAARADWHAMPDPGDAIVEIERRCGVVGNAGIR